MSRKTVQTARRTSTIAILGVVASLARIAVPPGTATANVGNNRLGHVYIDLGSEPETATGVRYDRFIESLRAAAGFRQGGGWVTQYEGQGLIYASLTVAWPTSHGAGGVSPPPARINLWINRGTST